MKMDVPEGEYTLPIGKAKVVREGDDVTVIVGRDALRGAREREEVDGACSAEVIDLRTLWPVDIDTIVESVKKTGRVRHRAGAQGVWLRRRAARSSPLRRPSCTSKRLRCASPVGTRRSRTRWRWSTSRSSTASRRLFWTPHTLHCRVKTGPLRRESFSVLSLAFFAPWAALSLASIPRGIPWLSSVKLPDIGEGVTRRDRRWL
ncbi:MAG: transketolase C-terminal domain-containing protein [Polyangiales bacterium]